MPLVSVVMPVYNEEKFVRDAIDSILNQTFTDFEFVIVDDGSSDSSSSILSEMAKIDARIKIITNQTNIGLVTSLNMGIEAAQGEWIARMDADDISLLTRLEKQVKYLEEHPYIDVLSTGMTNITMEGEKINSRVLPSSPSMLAWRVPFSSPAFHGTVMMRKSIVQEVGGYKTDFILEDNYLWSRLLRLKQAKFSALSESLYLYRRTRQEFENIISERRQATVDVCVDFISKIVGYPVLEEQYNRICDSAVNVQYSAEESNQALYLLLDLFYKMKNNGLFREEEYSLLENELSKRVIKIYLNTLSYANVAESFSVGRFASILWPNNRYPRFIKLGLLSFVKPKVVFKDLWRYVEVRIKRDLDG